jgi:hypothetical protein
MKFEFEGEPGIYSQYTYDASWFEIQIDGNDLATELYDIRRNLPYDERIRFEGNWRVTFEKVEERE